VDRLPGGLTNTNYIVHADGAGYVARISSDDFALLGIDRAREAEVLAIASAARIAPEVIAFILPEGHAVTRFLSDAHPLSIQDFRQPATVQRVARRLRDIHSLPPVSFTFDPYADIQRWLDLMAASSTARPARLGALLTQVERTEQVRAGAYEPVLCHNDPYHLNFLDDGSLWVIDWEYAGMGDPLYDLAGVAYTLDADKRNLLIETYLGSDHQPLRRDLHQVIGVYLCWNITWALVQSTRSATDFDYMAFAEGLFDLVP
jgi:thiamine kinase-like enzyme